MSSGIAINPKCISEFQNVRQRKYYAITLCIGDNREELIVDKVFENNKSVDPEAMWQMVIEEMPENDCRFLLCDFQWKVSASSTASKVCLIHWAPDTAPSLSKMVYATTRDTLSSQVDTSRGIQATEKEELSYAMIKSNVAK